MYIRGARIQIARPTTRGNADGASSYFAAGEWVTIRLIDYPGEPHALDTIGALTLGVHDQWGFWTSGHIDGAYTFLAAHVAVLEVPPGLALPRAFAEAPFLVRSI